MYASILAGEDYSTLESIRRTGGVVPDATWETNWSNAQATARIAARLGLKFVMFHAGFLPHDPKDPSFDKLIGRVRQIGRLFADHGLTLGCETGQETAPALLAFLGIDRAAAVFPLQIIGRQFIQEATGLAGLPFARAFAARAITQVQRLLRTGDADVGEAAFLVEVVRFHAGAVRQDAFLHADQEHVRKLQTLGRMQRHEMHAVAAGLVLVAVEDVHQAHAVDQFGDACVAADLCGHLLCPRPLALVARRGGRFPGPLLRTDPRPPLAFGDGAARGVGRQRLPSGPRTSRGHLGPSAGQLSHRRTARTAGCSPSCTSCKPRSLRWGQR